MTMDGLGIGGQGISHAPTFAPRPLPTHVPAAAPPPAAKSTIGQPRRAHSAPTLYDPEEPTPRSRQQTPYVDSQDHLLLPSDSNPEPTTVPPPIGVSLHTHSPL